MGGYKKFEKLLCASKNPKYSFAQWSQPTETENPETKRASRLGYEIYIFFTTKKKYIVCHRALRDNSEKCSKLNYVSNVDVSF